MEKVKIENKNENKFIKLLKSFTPYQITYLLSVVVLVALFAIFLPEEMLEDMSNPLVITCSVIAVLANPVCELLIAKQSKWNFIVSILFIEITESILYFSLGYYSVALISIIFWIPIDIVSFINWHKHPDQQEDVVTEVKRLTWVQDIFMVLAIFAFGFGVGYLLTLIPGAEDTYLDAFTSAVGMANGILILLRYNEQWIAWMITLILDAALYIMSGSYIMLITIAAMMVNTVYGFIKWLIYTNKHKNDQNKKDEEPIVENKKEKAKV
ncbi:MAG: nicotinamide mononucleotide transporter [Clostridia bacterium]|nr:nicotinamide mononucleotide transporter [Clostridia bacterium]